ncbi:MULTISPECIES: hypothetical protein [Pseudoalteromonas]|uniref:Uncharacterized protein n=1 Tax=Pseudoalteromonas obscura TaxID=3048491 RepID=A0ABT7EP55_9GAMM|nr:MULTISPECIES: hypothetical protein [Pseudoalteromonas]MBQ4834906.1 hypothetical protein [Pseudoalteromonas luteoviolacea]MDK2596793.1 hypothetical protein [Pseudoalteromonas sp. P94(2023)]
MKINLSRFLKVSAWIIGASAGSAFAQSAPLSCYWQLDNQNELGTWESQLCSNPVDASKPDILIANRVNIPSHNLCTISWYDGYRTELKGSIQVSGSKSACYSYSATFQPAPQTQLVDGIEETLLECKWEKGESNFHRLYCKDIKGQLVNHPVATKIQASGSNQCAMYFNSSALDLFGDGNAVVEAPSSTACDTDPIYFRPYPKKRIVDGVEEVLLQCAWQGEDERLQVKLCTDVGALGNDVAVAVKINGVVQSWLSTANRNLKSGQIIEDRALNSFNPPLYFQVN